MKGNTSIGFVESDVIFEYTHDNPSNSISYMDIGLILNLVRKAIRGRREILILCHINPISTVNAMGHG